MRLLVCLMALCVLGACSPQKPAAVPNEKIGTVSAPEKPAPPKTFKSTIIAANVFPDATEARLFINPLRIEIDEHGRPNKGSFPKRGIRLTSKEMKAIQKAVYYQEEPPYSIACCEPRHSVLFYKNGKYLGQVTVCFGCGCIIFSGEKPPEGMPDTDWDAATFARVIEAHGQKTEFE